MKTATYTLIDGSKKTIEYDELAPCIACGLPVVEASMGGTNYCPWCDLGIDRTGRHQDLFPRISTDEERARGKASIVFAPRRATEEQYRAALADMTEKV
jgi:uncharacterized Zn finger protein (UPF0148 family)